MAAFFCAAGLRIAVATVSCFTIAWLFTRDGVLSASPPRGEGARAVSTVAHATNTPHSRVMEIGYILIIGNYSQNHGHQFIAVEIIQLKLPLYLLD